MTPRILGLVLATALTAGCDTEQPPIGCPVQSLEWAATYKPKGPSICSVKVGEQLGIQKFSTPTGDERLVIKPETLAKLDEQDPERLSYSLGALAKSSDAEGFCSATDFPPTEKHVPGGDGVAPRDLVYQWNNVRVLATPRAPGTQMVADLTYTENGCTAEYEVWGMWPSVSCENEDGEPDNDICQNAGSINPDFSVTCEPTLRLCVPTQRPPSLQ
ncbi:hypothetical protein [Hyalangium rubrum]|uniref:Lipoprotein MlpA n=1 Tax=Hyalangium rubrum TaxID=3103134 RepID=A0ABU5H4U9_9BACT|nr:hypothetical protein [Hyalangium sp. s54d21]MDY7228099.1 hypothetical protein [Hyalangium sp. s54d21]